MVETHLSLPTSSRSSILLTNEPNAAAASNLHCACQQRECTSRSGQHDPHRMLNDQLTLCEFTARRSCAKSLRGSTVPGWSMSVAVRTRGEKENGTQKDRFVLVHSYISG